ISLAELRFGIAAMPAGRRKDALDAAIENRVITLFGSRLLSFDAAAATAYAAICARVKLAGSPMGVADSFIAATVAAHGFTVATRDTIPFKAAGLPVINPWEQE
ncbi:MAG: PIN domain-containing protein, partial [Sinobacteraceae bacterium]|nr:PIN domain-containing protein [Nevskiaceae bacterium]